MISKKLFVCAALPALLMGTAAHGSMWLCDFSTMTGIDDQAVAPYTDTDGLQPNQFYVDFHEAPGISPYLYKTANNTVMLDNQGAGGRVRMATFPQDSFNIQDGVSIATMSRVGPVNNPNRSHFEFRARDPGGTVGHGAWVRLRNTDFGDGTVGYIDLGRENHVDSYHDRFYVNIPDERGIKQYVLDRDMTNVWAQITVSGVFNPDDTSAGRRWSYWKFWLDGELLQFEGPSGAAGAESQMIPNWQGHEWSFRLSNLSGGNSNRLSMTHTAAGDWMSEFDFYNYRDDGFMGHWIPEPASLLLLASGGVFLLRRRRS